MYYKIVPIIFTPGKKANTTSDIFIAQPDTVKESLAGKLFILVEIETKKITNLKIINFLIDNINNNYYQNEKIMLRERIGSLKVEHIFEAALIKTNKNFVEFLRNEKINFPSINILAGVLYENKLHFANTGQNNVLLIHKIAGDKKITNNSPVKNSSQLTQQPPAYGEYKISDIARQTAALGENENKNNTKLFTNVVSGHIPPNGHFIITNEALPEYISPKQLIQIITTLPPASAVEQIKYILSKINAYVSFLGIIIKSAELKSSSEHGRVQSTTQDSIVGLNKTEEATENLLTPSGIINFKKWTKLFNAIFVRSRAKQPKSSGRVIMLKDKIIMKRKSSSAAISIVMTTKSIFMYLVGFLTYTLKILTDKNRITKALAGFRLKTEQGSGRLVALMLEIKNLNKKNKILLILSVAFLLLFISNISVIKIKNTQMEQHKEYLDLTTLIEKKQNQAEANLLYSNEEGAQELFTEIKNLIAKLPRDTEEQIKQLSQFKEKLDLQWEKIRRITRIDNPLELADFTNLNSLAKAETIVLIPGVNKIYAADSAQKLIYILDIESNLITTVTDLKKPTVNLRLPAVAPNNTIYYYNDNSIVSFDANTENLNNLSLNIADGHELAAADTYNSRLYLLDAGRGQIYKYNKSGQGFLSPYSWAQENIDLEQAVDMSIDGHIYILNSNGQILKLLRGRSVEFTLELVDPTLEAPTKLFVSLEQKYIYILEPKHQRLVLFDKTGQFLMQYQNKDFADLKDFSIDEKNKIIYFLDNAKVYAFDAVHFEE